MRGEIRQRERGLASHILGGCPSSQKSDNIGEQIWAKGRRKGGRGGGENWGGRGGRKEGSRNICSLSHFPLLSKYPPGVGGAVCKDRQKQDRKSFVLALASECVGNSGLSPHTGGE